MTAEQIIEWLKNQPNDCSAGEVREDKYGHYSVAEAESIDGSEQKGLIFARGKFVERK